jgi:hypothetical protein
VLSGLRTGCAAMTAAHGWCQHRMDYDAVELCEDTTHRKHLSYLRGVYEVMLGHAGDKSKSNQKHSHFH